jgi:hypothetical protein
MDTPAGAGYAARWTTEGTSGVTTVTEEEWWNCTEPEKMLRFLQGKASDRKFRLFAAACCRSIWHLLEDEQSRDDVTLAERYADGLALGNETTAAGDASHEADRPLADGLAIETLTAYAASLTIAVGPAQFCAFEVAMQVRQCGLVDKSQEQAKQVALLRCIFVNPFHTITISPSILAWNDAAVVRLAQAAYDERHLPEGTLDTGRLAVLADALEEAGCTDADMLGHLRGPGPHVRGCWPVDLCLGNS